MAGSLLVACRSGQDPESTAPEVPTSPPTTSAPATTTTTTAAPPATTAAAPAGKLLAAGDIAWCGGQGDEATAALLDRHEGTIVTLGDNVYDRGTAEEFARCYDSSWGRHRDRTRPAPGNHDYGTRGAAAYFDYFGEAAGERGRGWYSFDVAGWHVIALNSNCVAVGGCGTGSEQERWLRADLTAHPRRCTLAYWHHARFSSGLHGSNAVTAALWNALHEAGADVVLAGHDHHYEQFVPLGPDGQPEPATGLRGFVVGTGGRSAYPVRSPIAGSKVRYSGGYGILELTLKDGAYDWRFLAVEGSNFTDSGSDRCR